LIDIGFRNGFSKDCWNLFSGRFRTLDIQSYHPANQLYNKSNRRRKPGQEQYCAVLKLWFLLCI